MSLQPGDRSLAEDKAFIDGLTQRSDELLSKLNAVNPALDNLSNETAKMNLLFKNVIGDLNTLSEKRFIENRVEFVHERKPPPDPKEPEVRVATEDELREAVRLGLRSFGLLPAGELTDTITDYECFQRDRPFSLVIGSQRWIQEDPFKGVEVPISSGSLEESLISEAIDDLVSPEAAFEIEEATEATEWYEREERARRPDGLGSITGDNLPEDTTSVSSSSDLSRSTISAANHGAGSVRNPLPGGLFDESSDDDDGDLFGVTRKPSGPSLDFTAPKKRSSADPQSLPNLDNEVETSPPAQPSAQPPAQPSLLDELKSRTKQRAALVQNPLSPPATSAAVAQSREQLPVKEDPRPSQSQTRVEVADKSKPPATLPGKSETVTTRKPLDLFASDSDSDLLSSSKPSAQPFARPAPSVAAGANEAKRPSITKPTSLLRRNTLFDSDTDSDSDIFTRRPTPIPKPYTETIVTREPVDPVSKKVIGVPVLPPTRAPRLSDSDSDEDIFGAKVTSPKPTPLPTKLPSLPDKTPEKKPEIAAVTAELQSRQHIPKPLESFVKPLSSESDEELPTRHQPQSTLNIPNKKVLPTKTLKLFDSDSDGDSLFSGPTTVKVIGGQSDIRDKTGPSTISNVGSEQGDKVVVEEKVQSGDKAKTDKMSDKKESMKKVGGVGLPSGLLESLKQKQQQMGKPRVDLKNQSSDSEDGTRSKPSSTVKDKNEIDKISDPLGISGEDKAPAGDVKSPIEEKSSPVEVNQEESKPTEELPPECGDKTKDDKVVEVKVEQTKADIVDKVGQAKKEGENSSKNATNEEKSSTPKEETIKKMGVGLPAGLLQGLKMKQQQLGIAPKERKSVTSSGTENKPASAIATRDRSESASTEQTGKSIENKGLVNITKSRARGPAGRRLPSRTNISGKSESSQQKSEEQRVTTTPADASSTSVPKEDAKTEDAPEIIENKTPEAKDVPKTAEEPKTAEVAEKQKLPEPKNATGSNAQKPSKSKESAKLFSSDSDDDLFSAKIPSQKKTPKSTSKAEPEPTTPSIIDPLGVLSPSSEDREERLEQSTKTEDIFSPSTTRQTVESKAADQLKPAAKKTFLDDSDDEDLFGTKRTAPTKDTTDVKVAKNAPKDEKPKSTQHNLFGSDSDTDDLFKK